MRTVHLAIALVGWTLLVARVEAQPLTTQSALEQLGVRAGLCVVAARDATDLPIELCKESELLIYVQTDKQEVVDYLQQAAAARGLLGTRLYVERGSLAKLHLADNLADAAIVVGDEVDEQLRGELLRVTHPAARIITAEGVIINPRPAGADDWSHPYHGPDNNPQSLDQNARAPYLTQFLCEPWYVPMPQVTVASGGRVFKAFGHIALKEREWPWLNKLVAINGYNGTMLWQRDLTAGFMIHRNTLIATPEAVYLGDDQSCKVLDAVTGQVRDEMRVPASVDPGGVWKWMALQDEILYALVGPSEVRDTVIQGGRLQPGWPWNGLGEGYAGDYTWGFGRTLLAMRPRSKEILWTVRFEEPIDSRAMCMAAGRIFVYSHQKHVACVEAATGNELWRTTDPELLAAIGQHDRAQDPRKGFSSTAYAKANKHGLYFAGPQRTNLVAVSPLSGSLMWQYPHGNFQLVLRDDALYAMGRLETSKKFDYLSGQVLADLDCYRGNCTRATGTIDSIFTRGYRHTGTMRLDLSGNDARRIALMRPACQDGVIVSEGQLYWGPWMCDCNHSLIGMICLAASGNFDPFQPAKEDERLETTETAAVAAVAAAAADWPAYRGNALREARSEAIVADQVHSLWGFKSLSGGEPTAPIAVGETVYWSGLDGVVRAVNGKTGEARWKAFTGGAVRFPPEYWNGRLYVGSGDGFVYCFDAHNGALLWRFRAAPANRKIAVHGKLLSNWPVGSGVLVEDGTVYAAAGITSYDGTHVYALDAATGKIKWQNNASGQLAGADGVTGVSVQGHLLLRDDRLYLAGGNVISPAVYDVHDGRCLNALPNEWFNGQEASEARFPPNAPSEMFHRSPRGRELFLVDGEVRVFDELLYSPPQYGPSRYYGGHFLQAGSEDKIVRGTIDRVVRLSRQKADDGQPIGLWQTSLFHDPRAIAVSRNTVVVAGELASQDDAQQNPLHAVAALSLSTGELLWSQPLTAPPASWGLAIEREGRCIITLTDGSAVCVGAR